MTAFLPLPMAELPEREENSHKGTYGSVLIVAGSRRYPGAAVLAALGAGRSGAGLVRLCVPKEIVPAVTSGAPFATILPCPTSKNGCLLPAGLDLILEEAKSCHSIVLGPGLGLEEETEGLVTGLLREGNLPLVLDADGLNHLARSCKDDFSPSPLHSRTAPTILTPHPGEYVRLAKPPVSDPPEGRDAREIAAACLAQAFHSVVVLKGNETVVTDGERLGVEEAGNPGMATAGMGDVLAGVIGALLARIPEDVAGVARLAVHLHARAGDLAAKELGQESLLAPDVAERLGRVMAGKDS